MSNPLDPPTSWRIDYLELSTLPALGKGVAVHDGYAYLYGPFEGDVIAARLPLGALASSASPSTLLQYLSADGAWKPGLVPSDARKMGLAANSGLTLRFPAGRSPSVSDPLGKTAKPSSGTEPDAQGLKRVSRIGTKANAPKWITC